MGNALAQAAPEEVLDNAAPRPIAPWRERLFAQASLGPAGVGAAIAALLWTAFIGTVWAFGRFEPGSEVPGLARNLSIGTVIVLLIGYLVAAHRYLCLWTAETLRQLAPSLALSPAEMAALEASVGTADPRSARRAGGIGVLLALCAPPIADRGVGHFFTTWYWGPETAAHWLAVLVIGWLTGRLIFASMLESRRVSGLADRIRSLDVLDLRPLAPFTRQGLRTALLWLVFIGIASLLLTNRGFGPLLGLLGLVALYFAVRALLLPVRRVRDRIVAAKQVELDTLRREIRRDREAVRALADDAASAAARLPGLLAYESRVEGVREWPFDAPTLARFVLYLVIPVGSWLGGALVERALGVMLD